MQAITIDHDGAAAALGSDVPSAAPAAGEVVVRVHASSVNPIDAAIAAGVLGRIVRMLADGSLKLPIAATYELADAPAALTDLGTNRGRARGKRMLKGILILTEGLH